MEEIVLLDAAERYLNGEMTAQEKSFFEELRRTNPEVDQIVVEHQFFLNQMNGYADLKQFKATLNETHDRLLEEGSIAQSQPSGGKVVRLWNKHKRTIAVAASIACVTALTISGLLSQFSQKNSADKDFQLLSREINQIKKKQNEQSILISKIDGKIVKTPADTTLTQRSAGTSFLIDAKGYLVTNSHVINNAKALVVSNNGKDYYATTIYNDPEQDLAILKIQDPDYVASVSLPYSIRKSGIKLGEEIFTLGYPRNEIVYGKGYLSAQSGFNDDTLSVQISITANPGNSGGPVFDKNGDVIGVLNSRERNADGVVFANKAVNIAKLLDNMKDADTSFRSVKLPLKNILKGKETTQQVEQLKGCVFMVKVFTK